MPSASDANQWYQVVSGAVEPWNSTKPKVPTIPETAVAMPAAASSPSTRRKLSRL
jgi:hypothetical protein